MHQQQEAVVPVVAHQRAIRESDAGCLPMALVSLDGFVPIEELRGFTFGRVPRPVAAEFVRTFEWLGTPGPAVGEFFGLWRDGALFGVEGFAPPMHWLARQLGADLAARTRILTRGACTLAAGPNAASTLIGAALRQLRREGIALVIAHADERAGESGGAYRAANARAAGWTSAHPQYQLLVEGKWRDARELLRRHRVTRYTQLPPNVQVDAIHPESEPKRRFLWLLDKRVANALPASWSRIAPRPRTPSKPYQPTQGSRARRAQQLAVNLPPLRRRGRPRKGDDVPFSPLPSRGNSAAYLAAKLRRDHPNIAEALAAGAYPSVRAAMNAAKGLGR